MQKRVETFPWLASTNDYSEAPCILIEPAACHFCRLLAGCIASSSSTSAAIKLQQPENNDGEMKSSPHYKKSLTATGFSLDFREISSRCCLGPRRHAAPFMAILMQRDGQCSAVCPTIHERRNTTLNIATINRSAIV